MFALPAVLCNPYSLNPAGSYSLVATVNANWLMNNDNLFLDRSMSNRGLQISHAQNEG